MAVVVVGLEAVGVIERFVLIDFGGNEEIPSEENCCLFTLAWEGEGDSKMGGS